MVDLPVTGVDHPTRRGGDGQGAGLRDRVGHRHKLDVENADIRAVALGDAVQRHLPAAVAVDLALDHRSGEGRSVNRAIELLDQMRYRPDMVFVGVGDGEANDLAAAIEQRADIGDEHVHARRAEVAEGHPAIHDQPLIAVPVGVKVHANFTAATQGYEQNFILGRFCQARSHRSPLAPLVSAVPCCWSPAIAQWGRAVRAVFIVTR